MNEGFRHEVRHYCTECEQCVQAEGYCFCALDGEKVDEESYCFSYEFVRWSDYEKAYPRLFERVSD